MSLQTTQPRKAVKMMRDRLIELLKESGLIHQCAENYNDVDYYTGKIADYLLANGVIVPPCYIGQEIWHNTKHYDGRIETRKGKVSMLQQKADKSWKIRITVRSSVWDFSPDEIGVRYFFSKEDAEKALKGGAE